jgi:hypothetical protein
MEKPKRCAANPRENKVCHRVLRDGSMQWGVKYLDDTIEWVKDKGTAERICLQTSNWYLQMTEKANKRQ